MSIPLSTSISIYYSRLLRKCLNKTRQIKRGFALIRNMYTEDIIIRPMILRRRGRYDQSYCEDGGDMTNHIAKTGEI